MTLQVGKNTIDVTRQLALSAGKGWREMIVTDACAPGLGNGFSLSSTSPLMIQIAGITRTAMPEGADCSY